MSFIWMIVAGLIVGAVAKLLMPSRESAGLFVLGIAGSILAGGIQYSESQPIGFIVPLIGAAILLVLSAATAVPKTPAKAITRDDFRRAA